MIEFKGEMSEKTKKHVRRMAKQRMAILLCLTCMASLPLFRMVVYEFDPGMAVFLAITIGVGFIGLVCICPTKKELAKNLPCRIYVNDGIIQAENDHYRDAFVLKNAKELIDYGDFYIISLGFLSFLAHFVFEKSLITQGTLEEFEQLFEGKIVRKGPRKKKEDA